MFDFRQITLFCLGYRLSKHKMTICSENRGGASPPGYACGQDWQFCESKKTKLCNDTYERLFEK